MTRSVPVRAPRSEEGLRLPADPSPLARAEMVLIAELARACALLDERLSGAWAVEENPA